MCVGAGGNFSLKIDNNNFGENIFVNLFLIHVFFINLPRGPP